ncbi:hypothetical protein ACFVU3_34695 [Streptomyces sp. NPDC058052]|uniref:hypothetical protein n=1 Tax=Streptomyces sp. NPDC058052 TaxID=3346316 RepID=UPI0036EB0ED0
MTFIGLMILGVALATWAGITVGETLKARRAGVRPRRSAARRAAWGAVLAYLLGGALHLYGLSYMSFLQPEDACWFKAGHMAVPDSSSALPVSLVCAGEEIVPWWVNPGLLLLALAAVGLTVASPVLAVRNRRR